MEQFFVHPTSIIDPDVTIGRGTKVWHFCHISSDAVIGDDCVLGQSVFVGRGVTIGNAVKVQNNVSIYTGVEVEDDVFLGPSMVFTNVINPRSAVERKDEFQKTRVRRGTTIGANATILCGIEIGEYAFIGAGAVVTRSVKPYELVVGNPATHAGWMSRNGRKLVFNESGHARCPGDGTEYRLIDGKVMISE